MAQLKPQNYAVIDTALAVPPGALFAADPVAKGINAWVDEVWKSAGAIADFDLFPTDILVAHYIRKTVGASGSILAAAATQREDKYQGKCGLVLACGSQAFVDGHDAQFHGFSAAPGDWVVYRNSDGRDMELCLIASSTKVLVKVLRDGEIFMKVPRPDRIW